MPGIGVSISGDSELARALKATGHRLVNAIGDAVAETALNVETQAKRNITDNGTTDTARLVSSLGIEMVDEVTADVGSTAEYAGAVEHGAAPHWVPIDPLKDWARRKLGDEDAAYAVQAKIAASGTEAQPFLTPAREREIPKVRDTMIKHARKVTGK